MTAVTTRRLRRADAATVLRIYDEGIASGHATFEADAGDWAAWDEAHSVQCRIVAETCSEVLGWAALSAVSSRCIYDRVAEVSVYVAGSARGRGVGRTLLQALIRQSEAAGLWTLQAGIFPENSASLVLHERLGFRVVGIRQRLGRMRYGPLAERWRDVVLLERRSTTVGVD